jgi:acyl-CoA thioesterase FadM
LAVLDLSVKYLKPLKVGDQFQVSIECHMVGSSRVAFKYKIHLGENLVTEGQTLHVGLNSELKVVKPPLALIKGFQNYGP